MEILVYGHKNPDSDAICTSIAYSHLKNLLGENTKAVRIGELNEETKYVLNYFNVEIPELVENVAGKDIILIDHNERTQTADGFEDARVLELIDHHRIANFVVDEPLYVRMEAVGCTSTIVNKLYKENGIVPSKEMAGMMCSAIISDTLLFKSPTCTQDDIDAIKELSEIAGVDYNKYGMDMLEAGTKLSHKTEKELLNLDMKIFNLTNNKLAIAQVNTVNEAEILERKEKLELEMKNMIKEDNLSGVLFVITNILTNNSIGIKMGNIDELIKNAFNVEIENNQFPLNGVVSRKKQIVPPLTKTSNL